MAWIANPRAVDRDCNCSAGGSNANTCQSFAEGRINEAATWLAAVPKPERLREVSVELRSRFNLTPTEACAEIREAKVIRGRAT